MRFLLAILCIGVVLGDGNPFAGVKYYVNPEYQKELDTSIATASGKAKQIMTEMRDIGSAYWIDVMSKVIGTNASSVQGILMDAAKKSPKELVVLIVYDLPNRDCDAKASNGEICCYPNDDGTCDYNKQGDCAEGLSKYQKSYIDPFAKVLKQYVGSTPVVLIIEPDSLGNIATNLGHPHCGNPATVNAYKTGIPYAVKTLKAACPSCSLYLDAAHGGWLGWEDNVGKFKQLVEGLDVISSLRGMATNTANYQPVGTMCPWAPGMTNNSEFPTARNDYCLNGKHQEEVCCKDPCQLEGQWNPANNEANYVNILAHNFPSNLHYIIDTGRNGVDDCRTNCQNWCNPRGAGIGYKPTSETINPNLIDAYYWLKTPGESDGCTQTLPSGDQCARYDSMCGSVDSIGSTSDEPRVPEAGHWFDYQIKQLATNSIWS